MFCTCTHMSSIPMGAMYFKNVFLHLLIPLLFPWVRCIYMQECSVHSLMHLLFPWVQCIYTCKNVFTLTDTTSIPMGGMYLQARMFCTLAHTSSIPMCAMYLYLQECFLHSLIQSYTNCGHQ